MSDNGYEPKIIGFLCNWCSYAGADGAGMARRKYPTNIKIVRVPCSGRVSPELVLRAFLQGADGVMVLGCHIGDCHYGNGNHRTAKRFPVYQRLMDYMGIEKERLWVQWVSASEGQLFAEVVTEFTERLRDMPPMRGKLKEVPIRRSVTSPA
jgi:coenzyme F420-reducing hydrogenase delta subunit